MVRKFYLCGFQERLLPNKGKTYSFAYIIRLPGGEDHVLLNYRSGGCLKQFGITGFMFVCLVTFLCFSASLQIDVSCQAASALSSLQNELSTSCIELLEQIIRAACLRSTALPWSVILRLQRSGIIN